MALSLKIDARQDLRQRRHRHPSAHWLGRELKPLQNGARRSITMAGARCKAHLVWHRPAGWVSNLGLLVSTALRPLV